MAHLLSPVWFNDGLAESMAVCIDAGDRGLVLGDGLFETLPVFTGKPVFLNAHLARLAKGAEVFGIPLDREAIEAAISKLLGHHGTVHGILRITATRGAGARGLAGQTDKPTLLITLASWAKGSLYAPVNLITTIVRRNEHSPASRHKTLSYIDNILAAREAAAAGADDALMLNGAGRVACSTISNVLMVSGRSLRTPALSEGVLPGIVRGLLEAQETRIDPADLFACDAVFLTNSVRLIRPVVSLDGRPMPQAGSARVRSLLEDLCQRITDDCGTDPRTVDDR
jgi:branched-chain amino acid aminotransferase